MDPRQTRLLAFLGVVLAALVAWIAFGPEPSSEGDDFESAFEVHPSDLQALHLVTAEGTMSAERDDAGWTLDEPFQGPADGEALDDLVDLANRLEVGPPMPAGQDPSTYGLDHPVAELRLERKDGTEHAIRLGRQAPVGYQSYVQVDGGPIRTARGHPADTLTQPFEHWRDHQVIHVAASAIRELAWRQGDQDWSARRDDDGLWWLGDGRMADAGRIRAFATTIAELRLDRFGEAPQEPGERSIRIRAGGDAREIIFAASPGGEGWRVRTPAGTGGVLLSIDDLFPPVAELLEGRLVPLSPSKVDRIEISLDGRQATISRGDAGWERDGADVDEAASRLLVDAKIDQSADLPAFDQPAGSVRAISGDREAKLLLGPAGGAGRPGRFEAGGPTFLVPQESVSLVAALLEP